MLNNTLLTVSTLLLINACCFAQNGSSSDTLHGLPVLNVETGVSDIQPQLEDYGIDSIVHRRTETIGFFTTMRSISEPSSVSTFSNYALNLNDFQKKPFVLDANIQTPIALGGKKWYSGKVMHTVHIIPQFRVRIFQNDSDAPNSVDGSVNGDASLPVRTPSYIPRITWYMGRMDSIEKDNPEERGEKEDRRSDVDHFFGLSLFHHSNGQDGPEFYPDSTINVYNGNFGELLVFELIYGGVKHYHSNRKFKICDVDIDKKKDNFSRTVRSTQVNNEYPYNRRLYWKASFEAHIPSLTNQEFLEYNLYGQYRLNLQGGLSWIPTYRDVILNGERDAFVQTTPFQSKEFFRLVGNIEYILDPKYSEGNQKFQNELPYYDLKRLNIYATLYWRMTGSPNSALFVQAGYWGSDTYNIYFQEQIMNFRFGLAMAFFKYPETSDFEKVKNYK